MRRAEGRGRCIGTREWPIACTLAKRIRSCRVLAVTGSLWWVRSKGMRALGPRARSDCPWSTLAFSTRTCITLLCFARNENAARSVFLPPLTKVVARLNDGSVASNVGLGGQGVKGLGTAELAGDGVHTHDDRLLVGQSGDDGVLVLGRLDVAVGHKGEGKVRGGHGRGKGEGIAEAWVSNLSKQGWVNTMRGSAMKGWAGFIMRQRISIDLDQWLLRRGHFCKGCPLQPTTQRLGACVFLPVNVKQ